MFSRALIVRADDPVRFFKDNPLQVVKGEDGNVGIGFGQPAYDIRRSGAKNVGDLFDKIQERKLNNEDSNKVKFTSDSGVTFDETHVMHAYNKHGISKKEMIDIENNFDNISVAALSKMDSLYGQRVLLKVVGENTYGVVVDLLPNGRFNFNTAFVDGKIENGTKNNVDAWIKEKGARVLSASDDNILQSGAGSGHPLSLTIIKDALGAVNQNIKDFNPNIGMTANQQSDRILGKYQPIEQEGTGIIRMFDGADASTVIHETGHYFLDAMARDVARGIADEKTAFHTGL